MIVNQFKQLDNMSSYKNKIAMTKYAPISKEEIKLISQLEYEDVIVVSRNYLLKLYKNDSQKVDYLLSDLTKKGRLKQLARTKYLVIPIKAPYQMWSENEFIIADALMDGKNYYIGYNNMFNFYRFTQQIPQTTFVLNTRFSKRKIIDGKSYKFIKINENKLYGLTTLKINRRKIWISDKERTLVDLVYNFKPIGSIKGVFRIIKSEIKNIDTDKFIIYAAKFPNITTRKRIGYYLSNLKIKDKSIKPIIESISKSNTLTPLYESKSRKGKIDKKWKLIINE